MYLTGSWPKKRGGREGITEAEESSIEPALPWLLLDLIPEILSCPGLMSPGLALDEHYSRALSWRCADGFGTRDPRMHCSPQVQNGSLKACVGEHMRFCVTMCHLWAGVYK